MLCTSNIVPIKLVFDRIQGSFGTISIYHRYHNCRRLSMMAARMTLSLVERGMVISFCVFIKVA